MRERGELSRKDLEILQDATSARINLGRVGQGLPTTAMLDFQLDHARAKDAVHAALDVGRLRAELGQPTIVIESAAANRQTYLRRPELGRRPDVSNAPLARGDYDLALVLADGLSAAAVQGNGPLLIKTLSAMMMDWTQAPLVIAVQARVAIGDPIGQSLGARSVVVVIGERPGLSAADSLSAYITFNPRPGCRDSERNCVSNIRPIGGLSLAAAANKISWLLREAQRLGFSGVALKDRQPDFALQGDPQRRKTSMNDRRRIDPQAVQPGDF